ncbi:MAG: hypothetical protein HQL86_00135 [Magnetococcales bacterium]|nr:hypothetical protein [Magnetococcales bacterium]
MAEERKSPAGGPGENFQTRNHFTENTTKAQVNLADARKFLQAVGGDGPFCFQLINSNGGQILKSVPFDEQWSNYIAQQNLKGDNVFVTVNQTDGIGRKTSNITRVRAIFVDLDGAPFPNNIPLTPSVIVNSSPGKFHIYWFVDDLPLEEFRVIQKNIAHMFDGDRMVIDLPRVMRVPGFLHLKNEPFCSELLYSDPTRYTADQIRNAFRQPFQPETVVVEAASTADISPYARRALESEVARVLTAQQGTRNATLNEASFKLGSLVASGALSRTMVEVSLLRAAAGCGLLAMEAGATVKSGIESGLRHPRKVHEPQYREPSFIEMFPDRQPLKDYPFSDLGNSQRLLEMHGQDLRFVEQWKTWLVWNGKCWSPDRNGEVQRRAIAMTEVFRQDEFKNNGIYSREFKFAQRSQNRPSIDNAITLARSNLIVAAIPEQFDTKSLLLNVENGTIDLQTMKLRKHCRDDMITKTLRIQYDKNAQNARWLHFVNWCTCGDVELARFIQKAVGYSLTGETSEQILFYLYGLGANGKSTFIETIFRLLESLAERIPSESLMLQKSGSGQSNDIAGLVGKRLVVANEVGEGVTLNESRVKEITGSDMVAARRLYQEFFNFRPQFKLWIVGNHRPIIKGTDHGIWRRIRMIPFNAQIAEADKDPYLQSLLPNGSTRPQIGRLASTCLHQAVFPH